MSPEAGVQSIIGVIPESSVADSPVKVTIPDVDPASNPLDMSSGQVINGGVVSEKDTILFSVKCRF